MPEPVGTSWFTINTAHWLAGQYVRETRLLQQVLENLQYLAISHNHSGGTGNGGTITTADPKSIWFYSQTVGAIG